MKICKKCNLEKDLDSFHRDKKMKDGKYYICKQCLQKPAKVEIIPEIEGEIWKDVIGYEGLYQISNKLRVKNILRNHIMFNIKHNNGYLVVALTRDKKSK